MKPRKGKRHQPSVAPTLEKAIIDALGTVYDPEIPVNVYELGLIYDIEVKQGGNVVIRMTLTSPGCPVAVSLPIDVQSRVREIPGVTSAKVEIVWDPPWNPDMISEAGKLQLGLY